MAAERKTIRVFADVIPGFDPLTTVWNGPAQAQYHMNPPPNSKRLWFDIEVPADHEIWPDQYRAGVNIGDLLNPAPRRMILDENTRDPRNDDGAIPPAEMRRRRMARAEVARPDEDMER